MPGESGLVLRFFGGESWAFDEAGLPARITRGPGTDVELTHEDGRLAELRHSGGRSVARALDRRADRGAGVLRRAHRRPTATTTTGALVRPTAPRARAHYEIGDAGRVLSVADADGVVEVANAYDEQGRVIRQLSPFGRNTMFGYLPGHVTVTSDDTDGPTNVFIHDRAGRLVSLSGR